MAKTYLVPILCTRGVVVFPSQEVNIDIGREESKIATEYAYSHNSYIFVVAQKQIETDKPGPDDVYEYGTLCKVQRYRKKDDYLRVGFLGYTRARILRHHLIENIKSVEVEVIKDTYDDELVLKDMTTMVLTEFDKIKKHANPTINVDLLKNLRTGISASELTDYYAQVFLLDYRDKQVFLEKSDVIERLALTLEYIRRQIRIDSIDAQIEEKVRSSIEDSQKDFYLREKLRAIKDELNDGNSSIHPTIQKRFIKFTS